VNDYSWLLRGAVVVFVGSWIDAFGAVAEFVTLRVAVWVCLRVAAAAASVVSYFVLRTRRRRLQESVSWRRLLVRPLSLL